jgi:hypothetical protein
MFTRTGLTFPRPPLVLQDSHQLCLLSIRRDYWIPTGSKAFFLPVDITMLRIAVGVLGTFLFPVELQE